MEVSALGFVALVLSALSAVFIVWFLVRSPPLTVGKKFQLFFALFALPTTAALIGNVGNLETTKTVHFCGSCHVMTSHVRDLQAPDSRSLASLHGRLGEYAEEACYNCHADYGMYGGVTTKLGGMRHVWDFYTGDWERPDHAAPALYKPFDLRRCTACHDPLRKGAPLEHQVHAEKLRTLEISCASAGCHGPPHPPWSPAVVR